MSTGEAEVVENSGVGEAEVIDESVGAGADPGATVAVEPGEAGAAKPPGNKRARDRMWKENVELRAAMEASEQRHAAQVAELSSRLGDSMDRLTRTIASAQPRAEDPIKAEFAELKARQKKVIAKFEKDPSAVDEYQDIQFEMSQLAARAVSEQRERNAPAPVSVHTQRLTNEFPWLDASSGDQEARAAVNGEIARIVRREKNAGRSRNMGDPNVLYATAREAAATVGAEFKLPLPYGANGSSNGVQRDRMAGSSGRGGADGGSGEDFNSLPASDVLAAATAMYPELSETAAVAKWKNNVGKRHFAGK